MTSRSKRMIDSHSCFSPVLGRTAARRLRDDHRLKDGSSSRGIVTDFCRQNDGVRRVIALHHASLFRNETAARRCASALRVRSRVVLRGGVSWWELFRISGGAGQARTSEQLFIPGAKIFRGSVWSSGRSGLMIRLPASRSARNARSATRVFSSTASASRTPKRCTRSMARSLATESRAKEPEASGGLCAKASHAVRVGEPTRIGKLSWPALGRTSNVSERGVTGGESAALNFLQGRAARSAHVAHNHEVVSSNLTPATSSGDGLGIHQPGSMTRGTRAKVKTPSGRARDRAICPAVARFIDRRAA